MWINISKSGNSFMTGGGRLLPQGVEEEEEEVFSRGMLAKNNNSFMCEAPSIVKRGSRRARGRENV